MDLHYLMAATPARPARWRGRVTVAERSRILGA
jgi:hypothetical protein